MLFYMNWKLTFIVLTIVPMYALITFQFTRKSKKLIRRKQDIEAEIAQHIGEKFGGIQAIKSYCSEDIEIEKYMASNLKGYEVVKEKAIYEAIHTACSNFLPSLGILFVLLYAGLQLLKNNTELSAGELTAFILYCTNLAETTSAISNCYINILNGVTAIGKVMDMMEYERQVVEDQGREVEIDGSVEFDKV